MEVAAFHPCRCYTTGLVSVALFVTSPCQGVTLHPALRSPDFPLPDACTAALQRLPGRLPLAILRGQADARLSCRKEVSHAQTPVLSPARRAEREAHRRRPAARAHR